MHIFAFRHWSIFEIVSRLAALYAYIMPRRDASGVMRWYLSPAFNALDGSEKGAVNYWIGMTCASLLAREDLDVPFVMHLDVYSSPSNPYHSSVPVTFWTGNSRPDLIGTDISGTQWAVLEAKGRISWPSNEIRRSAKDQAENVRAVNGSSPAYAYASIASFGKGYLAVDWIDPPSPAQSGLEFKFDPDEYILLYYRLFVHLIRYGGSRRVGDWMRVRVPPVDLEVFLYEPIYRSLRKRYLRDGSSFEPNPNFYSGAFKAVSVALEKLPKDDWKESGIRVKLGKQWQALRG